MKNIREVLTLHFGQAGIQVGDALWQTVSAEHSINQEGQTTTEVGCFEESGMRTFFHTAPNSKYIPRALMVDSEPTVIDEIRTGYYRNLFHPDLMISGIEDAANNFSRGYYSTSQKMIYPLIEKCRYITETCDNFQGFMSYAGSGGGTGSGLFTMFLERALIEYSSKIFIGNIIVPGRTLSNCVVDPYNTIFKLTKSFCAEDINFILDNESLYGICADLDIVRPTYHSINKVLSPLFSTIIAPIRFGGSLTGSLNEISTNLIPYPRINFPTMTYSPFLSNDAYAHGLQSCKELTMSLFEERNNLLSQDLTKGLFMSSVLIYRGCHIVHDIIESIHSLKEIKKCRWVDWCPTGFKITQTHFPALHTFSSELAQPSKSILMLCNNSIITNKFDQESRKFMSLYQKKSYLHWYLNEGMEEIEFTNALDDISKIKTDYEYICIGNITDISYQHSEDYSCLDSQIKKMEKEKISDEEREINNKTIIYSPKNSQIKKMEKKKISDQESEINNKPFIFSPKGSVNNEEKEIDNENDLEFDHRSSQKKEIDNYFKIPIRESNRVSESSFLGIDDVPSTNAPYT